MEHCPAFHRIHAIAPDLFHVWIFTPATSPHISAAAVHVLDQIAGGVAGIERVTLVDSSPDMLEAIKVCLFLALPGQDNDEWYFYP